MNFVNLRDTVVPALITEFQTKFPENPLLIKQLAILEPAALSRRTNGVQIYANQLQPLVERFGGADQQIIFQCVEMSNYLDPLPVVAQWLSEGRLESFDAPLTDDSIGLVPAPQTPIEKFLEENPGKIKN